MKRRIRKPVRRAFTLLEVLMVVVIIGILAALVVPSFFGTSEKAKEDLMQSTIESTIPNMLKMYRLHMGTYPSTDEGLAALFTEPDDEELAKKWGGPYVDDAGKLKDAWGNEFIYEYPGQYNGEGKFDLSSKGRDGQEGTDDDITNWDKTR